MQYWDGSKWIIIPIGTQGQTLTVCSGVPTWTSSGSCPATISVLSPINNAYEGFISSYDPTLWQTGPELLIGYWTIGGNPIVLREQLKFDYSVIPVTAVIDSAYLYLYSDSTPQYGNGVDPMFGSANSASITRLTTPFTLPTPYTWNSPPAFTTVNQATIPQSNSSFENSTINVTNLVKDMIATNNYGFYMKLNTESVYNIRQYVSSNDPNISRRPKLVIYYH
ncbi:MAG: DNRLRE domain-containing protein [Ferruginibacter sp.]